MYVVGNEWEWEFIRFLFTLPCQASLFLSPQRTHKHAHTQDMLLFPPVSHSRCCHPREFTFLAVPTSHPGCPCCSHRVSLSELLFCHLSFTALLPCPQSPPRATNHQSDSKSRASSSQAASCCSSWWFTSDETWALLREGFVPPSWPDLPSTVSFSFFLQQLYMHRTRPSFRRLWLLGHWEV